MPRFVATPQHAVIPFEIKLFGKVEVKSRPGQAGKVLALEAHRTEAVHLVHCRHILLPPSIIVTNCENQYTQVKTGFQEENECMPSGFATWCVTHREF